MIRKAEILARAHELQLTAEVVEKDYVLGWMLWALSQHPETRGHWIFKGGTCLKKCLIETWRFSEDLDFSLTPDAAYTADELARLLREVTTDCQAASGLSFPVRGMQVRERRNKQADVTFEGRVEYRGPLEFPGSPKIRFDLTRHEPILQPTERRTILHPYSDGLPAGSLITTYATSELVAEKTRALWERTRPRDLYDVVLLAFGPLSAEESSELRRAAARKFAVKGHQLPSARMLCDRATNDPELRGEWSNMLAHQLPALPPLDDFLGRLPDAVAWLDATARQPRPPLQQPVTERAGRLALPPVSRAAGEVSVSAVESRRRDGVTGLGAVEFAASSHLLVEFIYHGVSRVVEPYALRRPRTGNLLLYGFERSRGGVPTNAIRAYKVAQFGALRVLDTPFVPRFQVELRERPGLWRW